MAYQKLKYKFKICDVFLFFTIITCVVFATFELKIVTF